MNPGSFKHLFFLNDRRKIKEQKNVGINNVCGAKAASSSSSLFFFLRRKVLGSKILIYWLLFFNFQFFISLPSQDVKEIS